MSVADVHGYYLNTQSNYFSPEGLVLPSKVEEEVEVIPAAPWVAPVAIIPNLPGISWLVGMTLACVKRTNLGLEVFVEDKLYQQAQFTGLEYTALTRLAGTIIAFIGGHFEQTKNTGNGREFINELYTAYGKLTKVQYLLLQWSMNSGPLSPCFNWGEFKGGKVQVVRHKKPNQDKKWVIMSVKKRICKIFQRCRKTSVCERGS